MSSAFRAPATPYRDMAKDASVTALEFYFDDKREIPAPSRVKRGQVAIDLPASVAATALLLNEMIAQDVRPSELARRMGTTAQKVHRVTQLSHAAKVDGIGSADKLELPGLASPVGFAAVIVNYC